MDREFEKELFKKGKSTSDAKRLLVSKTKTKIKSSLKLSHLIIDGSSDQITHINSKVIRTKMLELTLNFLEPFQHYFKIQYNVKLEGFEEV